MVSHNLWWMRFPGVIASALTAALLVVIGRRRSDAVGIVAGLLFAIAPMASRYAEDARPYSFAMLAATFATWRLLIALERSSRGTWAWYAVAVVLLGFTHLFALLILPAHGWYARRELRGWTVSTAAGLVVLSPLLGYGGAQVNGELSWAEKPGAHSLRAFVGELTGNAGLTVVFGVLLILGAVTLWRGNRDSAVLFGAWLVFPPVVLFTVSQWHPVFASRYLAFTLPALCLLVAVGLATLRSPVAAVAAVVVIALVVPSQVHLRRPVGHDGNTVAFIARELPRVVQPGDGILYEPTTVRRIFEGYAKPPAGQDVLLASSPLASNTLAGSDVAPGLLAERMSSLHRIWVVQVTDRNIKRSIYRNANADLKGFVETRRIPMPGGSITLWVAP
jgi:mannosyltransferase